MRQSWLTEPSRVFRLITVKFYIHCSSCILKVHLRTAYDACLVETFGQRAIVIKVLVHFSHTGEKRWSLHGSLLAAVCTDVGSYLILMLNSVCVCDNIIA